MKTSKLDHNFYDKIKPWLYHRAARELRLAHRVLDLGCGDCELVRYLSNVNFQEAIGVDISSAAFPDDLRACRDLYRIDCIDEDAGRLDTINDGAVDAIVMFWSFHEMKVPEAVLRQACRVLQAAGKILIIEFPRGSLAQTLWNENYYSSEELRNLLSRHGFKDIRAQQNVRGQILWVTALRDNICHETN